MSSCDFKNKISAKNKKLHSEKKQKAKEVIKDFNPKTIEDGKYLYVILKESPNKIIITKKENEKNDYKIKHHVLAGDKNIIIGGEIKVKGNEIMFDNNSGHYVPTPECLAKLKEVAEKKYGLNFVKETSKEMKKTTRRNLFFSKSANAPKGKEVSKSAKPMSDLEKEILKNEEKLKKIKDKNSEEAKRLKKVIRQMKRFNKPDEKKVSKSANEKKVSKSAKTTTKEALQDLPADIGSKISEELKAKQKPPTIEEVMDEVKKVLKNIKPNTDLIKARSKIRGLLKQEKNKKSIRAYAFKISIERIEKLLDTPGKLTQKEINAITMAKNTITNWRSVYDSKNMMG